MDSNKKVDIIIVTFGIKDYLKSCLDSIGKQTRQGSRVVIIDNSLNHDFNQETWKSYPGIRFYRGPNNLFYSGSLNEGIRQGIGEFVICLNDDVVLDRKFIEEALKGFDIDDKIGMVSGKILRSDGKTIDSTGLFLSAWRTAKERGYGLKDRGQYEKEEYIFGVNGAVAFYRRKMLEDIKIGSDYFDADYHFFYEDLDIAWRAQNSGWKGYYIPGAVAYHVRGASVRASCGINKPHARRYLPDNLHADLIKNRYLTIIKNDSLSGFLLHLPFIVLYDLAMWIFILLFRPKLITRFIADLRYLNYAFGKRRLIKRMEK